jgi:hypothetical protein
VEKFIADNKPNAKSLCLTCRSDTFCPAIKIVQNAITCCKGHDPA